MTDRSNEADARLIIDDLLRHAGWDPSDRSQVLIEAKVIAESQEEYAAERLIKWWSWVSVVFCSNFPQAQAKPT